MGHEIEHQGGYGKDENDECERHNMIWVGESVWQNRKGRLEFAGVDAG